MHGWRHTLFFFIKLVHVHVAFYIKCDCFYNMHDLGLGWIASQLLKDLPPPSTLYASMWLSEDEPMKIKISILTDKGLAIQYTDQIMIYMYCICMYCNILVPCSVCSQGLYMYDNMIHRQGTMI